MSKTKEAIARARRTATEAKEDAAEMMAGATTSYLIGSMEASGAMAQIPTFLGLPRTVTLAIAGKLLAYNSTGRTRQIANGAANAASHVAIYQFSRGQTVSGLGDDVGAHGSQRDRGLRIREAARAIAAEAQRAKGGGEGATVDDELDELEGVRPGAKHAARSHAS